MQTYLAAAVAGLTFALVIAWAISRIAKRLARQIGHQLDAIHLTLLAIEKHVGRIPADTPDQPPTDLGN